MADTNISWANAVWNPVTGCTKVSPGCKNCYAEAMTERFHGKNSFENIVLHPDRLAAPLHWKKPRMIFVNSMSDLFHEKIPFEFIDSVFAVMALCPQHTFQVLTKRPERMREYMMRINGEYDVIEKWGESGLTICEILSRKPGFKSYAHEHCFIMGAGMWPLPNVWLGVSVENQKYADERIPLLFQTPAAVRFVSAEPLLGDINLFNSGALQGGKISHDPEDYDCFGNIDWLICGGESGANRRECNPEWIQSIANQCRDAGVACFLKQDSGLRPGKQGRLSDELWSLKQYPKGKSPLMLPGL